MFSPNTLFFSFFLPHRSAVLCHPQLPHTLPSHSPPARCLRCDGFGIGLCLPSPDQVGVSTTGSWRILWTEGGYGTIALNVSCMHLHLHLHLSWFPSLPLRCHKPCLISFVGPYHQSFGQIVWSVPGAGDEASLVVKSVSDATRLTERESSLPC